MTDLHKIAAAMGGEVSGNRAIFPTPGHSAKDRGSWASIAPDAPDGVLVDSANGGDYRAIKDELRAKGVLPPRQSKPLPRKKPRTPGVSYYEFQDEHGVTVCRKVRTDKPDGTKDFSWQHPDEQGGWKSGRGCDPLLYRLPYLLAAPTDAVVYVAEGERKADKLASWGLVATSSKDLPDNLAVFAGRRVVILPDNDTQGKHIAEKLRSCLEGIAERVDTVELPNSPPAGDIMDWDGTADDLKALVEAARAAPADSVELLPMTDPADWHGVEVPPREWMLEGWEPRRSAVLVTGLGASGKSLLYQQRMTCSAAGVPFLGVAVTPGVSIYITCEDDVDELHRRQASINAALGIGWNDLRGRLKLVSLKGLQNNELCTFDSSGRMDTTPRWQSILATVRAIGATHVVLDNVAHLFAGSEIVRNHVAAFIGLLDRLAVDIGGGVILLGHPNKEGAEYSGSTAWENQVRSRIYLSLGQQDSGGVSDPDARELTNSKPNYSRRGEAIKFMWHKWAFVREDDLPPNVLAEQALTIRANAENARFLECMDKTFEEKRTVSASGSASNYAPRVFAKMPLAKGMKASGFEAAMQRLFHLGQIAGDQPVFQRDNRTWAKGLGRAQTPAQSLHKPYAQTRTEDGGKPGEILHKPAHAPDPYTYGNKGAPLGVGAPFNEEEKEAPQSTPVPLHGHAPEDCLLYNPSVTLSPGECYCDPVPGWEKE